MTKLILALWDSLTSEQTVSLKIIVYVCLFLLIQGPPEAALSSSVSAGKKL